MKGEEIIAFENAMICHYDHLVLSDVNFSISKAEFVYLIGKVGSGKSSLIRTINADLPLKKGEGIITGFKLSKLIARQIRYPSGERLEWFFRIFSCSLTGMYMITSLSYLNQQDGKIKMKLRKE